MRKKIYDALDEDIARIGLGKQQEILYKLARDFPELSNEELAKRAGTTVKTVYTQLSIAYKAVEKFKETGEVKSKRGKRKKGTAVSAKVEGCENTKGSISQEALSGMAEAFEYFAKGASLISKVLRALSENHLPDSDQFIRGILNPILLSVKKKKCQSDRESGEKTAEDG